MALAPFKQAQKDNPTVCTRGLTREQATRAKARANGTLAAASGAHIGGPCPAVCLATIAGWSYNRAFAHLVQFGYSGAGLNMSPIRRAYKAAMGEPTVDEKPPGMTVAKAARMFFGPGDSGAIANSRHIMPVVNGRVLNAFGRHLDLKCTDVLVYA